MRISANYLYGLFWVLITLRNALSQGNNYQEYYQALTETGALRSYSLMKYVVSIKYLNQETSYAENHICAGAIVTARVVLTVAHCLFSEDSSMIDPGDLVVMAGFTIGSIYDKGLQTRSVRETILHPDFVRGTYANDIAILNLNASFNFIAGKIQQVIIPRKPLSQGRICYHVGFGVLLFKGVKLSRVLKESVRVWSENKCEEYLRFHYYYLNGKFCAGQDNKPSTIPCEGLASKALICNDNLYGMLLFNIGCKPDNGFVLMDVSSYGHWLSQQIGNDLILFSNFQSRIVLPEIFLVIICCISVIWQ